MPVHPRVPRGPQSTWSEHRIAESSKDCTSVRPGVRPESCRRGSLTGARSYSGSQLALSLAHRF